MESGCQAKNPTPTPTLVWEFPEDFWGNRPCSATRPPTFPKHTPRAVPRSGCECRGAEDLQSLPQLLQPLCLTHSGFHGQSTLLSTTYLQKQKNKRLQNSPSQETAFVCFPRPLLYDEPPFSSHQKGISISRLSGGELVPSRISQVPGIWRAEPEETTVPWVILPHAAFLEVFLLLVVLKLEIG